MHSHTEPEIKPPSFPIGGRRSLRPEPQLLHKALWSATHRVECYLISYPESSDFILGVSAAVKEQGSSLPG